MNNLKRVLSLALSGIMLVGMMAFGASAAPFTDAEDIQHDEAVNILVALNIINGQDDGSFNPKGDVTRAQMAKMIAVAMNGGSDTKTGVKGTATFTDIKGHWAEDYIEYCADLAIISGRGDGTFDPDGKVTGIEATKMVLTALGYDAKAYELTGAKWATQADQLARQADISLYEELPGVVMSTPASREVAAQLIWNGLQNYVVRIQPNEGRNDGSISWNYGKTKTTLLKERYDAEETVGTFSGNYKTGHASNKGEVLVAGRSIPYDLPIEEIGEEFKVIWKDGQDSKNGGLDRKDVIYGIFNTHKTEVYHLTMDEIQGAGESNLKKGKIKFGGTLYDVMPITTVTEKDENGKEYKYTTGGVSVIYNYDGEDDFDSEKKTGLNQYHLDAENVQKLLKKQSVDTIKFVCDNSVANNGKIKAAYVTNYKLGRITSTNASNVTIQGVGTIAKADNEVYDGVAVDDVVVYTRFYDNNDKDEAFFTVTKAETVEGTLTGFKFDNTLNKEDKKSKYVNVVVDGETTKVHYPDYTLPANMTDDEVTDLNDTVWTDTRTGQAAIGDTVRLYKVGSMVGCVQLVVGEAGKYAVVTEVNDGTVGSVMNPMKVSVLFADGTEETLTVHKDSTYDGEKKIKDDAVEATLFENAKGGNNKNIELGYLIEYTNVTNGSIKIKAVAEQAKKNAGSTNVTKDDALIWDEDAKTMQYKTDTTAVAAVDSVMFVGVNRNKEDKVNKDKINNWYAYDMRSLGDIKNEYCNTDKTSLIGSVSYTDTPVQYFLNNQGLVAAACVYRNAKPGSTTTDTLYGVVTGFTGTRQNKDNEDLWVYTVAVGREKDVVVNIREAKNQVKVGQLVMFKERADAEYELGDDIIVIVGATDGKGGNGAGVLAKGGSMEDKTSFALGAVRQYNASKGVITFYYDTPWVDGSSIFKGDDETTGSYTVSKDVQLYYVDLDGNEQGDDVGVTMYDASTGYANVIMHLNDKGIVDAIIVETSGKANMASVSDDKAEGAGSFGYGKPAKK